jgi:hypothetical protein
MKNNTAYVPQDGTYPFKGMNTLVPSVPPTDQSTLRSCLDLKNLYIKDGYIKKVGGNSLIASSPQYVFEFIEFISADGVRRLVTVGATGVFTSTDCSTFSPIPPVRNLISIPGTNTNLVANDLVTQEVTGAYGKVTSVSASVVVIDVYVGGFNVANKIAQNGSDYFTPSGFASTETLNGGSSITVGDAAVSFCVASATQGLWLIMVYEGGEPFYWDGVADCCTPLRSRSDWKFSTFEACRSLAFINGHLVFVGVKKSGVWYDNDLAWGDSFSLVNFDTGLSGELLLDDSLIGLHSLQSKYILYGKSSIYQIIYIGGSGVFNVFRVISSVNILSNNLITNLNTFHVICLNSGLVIFDGQQINDHFSLGIKDELDSSILSCDPANCFSHYDSYTKTLYVGFINAVDFSSDIYICTFDSNFSDFNWSYLSEPLRNNISSCFSIGSFVLSTSFLWDGMGTKTWDSYATQWDSLVSKDIFPVLLYGGIPGVYRGYNDSLIAFTKAINAVYESRDYLIPQSYRTQYARWVAMDIEIGGSTGYPVTVEISVDGGVVWGYSGTINLTSAPSTQTIWFDLVGESCRLRLTSDGAFNLIWYRFQCRPQGK